MKRIVLSDTTLRDGLQQVGVNVNVEQRLGILEVLDRLAVPLVEAGWPGASPGADAFFDALRNVTLRHSRLKAFCATRRAWGRVETDDLLPKAVLAAVPVLTLFGKTSSRQVRLALGCSLEENLNMLRESVAYGVAHRKEVVFDAEHGCDAWLEDSGYLMACLAAAVEGGASTLVLCDTRGNNMPADVARLVRAVVERFPNVTVGVHMHDDLGLAVANTLAGVEAGATYVETSFNSYGERTGNADSVCVIADLQLKLGYSVLPETSMRLLTWASHRVAQLTGVPLPVRTPWSGLGAFAHKSGVHGSAVRKCPDLYEHVDPEVVGNRRHLVPSEQLGQAMVLHKAEELGLPAPSKLQVRAVVDQVKTLGLGGGNLEDSDTLELLLRRVLSGLSSFFEVLSWKAATGVNWNSSNRGEVKESSASVVVQCGGRVYCETFRSAAGPVDALDAALSKSLQAEYPQMRELRLADFTVQIKGAPEGMKSKVVALLRWSFRNEHLNTVGVSENLLEACFAALADAYSLVLFRESFRAAGNSIQDDCLGVGA